LDNLTTEFDEFTRDLFDKNVKFGIYLPPNNKSVFEYFLDVTSGNFVEWNQLLTSIEKLIRQGKSDDIIPTIDSIRFSFLATLLLNDKHSVLVTGSSGIGKTVTIDSMLKKLGIHGFQIKSHSILGEVFNYSEKEKHSVTNNMNSLMTEDSEVGNRRFKVDDQQGVLSNKIQFSAQTSSNKFISTFVSRLFKKGPNTMGAPKNKTIVTFIDDLNIPIADKFGDQACLEMLRFLNENGLLLINIF
jgi:dynein heavy chain